MTEMVKIEKFTSDDLGSLRGELMKMKLDSWQAADMVSSFLAGRGYGVDTDVMRDAIPRLAILSGSPERMQAVLEAVAYVM